MVEVLEACEEALDRAASIIRRGGLVAFPTETVYGLGACVFNQEAVAKIFEVKKRPRFDPIIVHVSNPGQLSCLCSEVGRTAKKLIERFWPGPLTLVLPKSRLVPYIVTAGLETVAIRMPSHPIALELIKRSETPIAAPSANLFGFLSPTTPEHVVEQLGEGVDMIIDGGRTPIGVESTIIDLSSSPELTLLRPGGLPVEEIEKVLGRKVVVSTISKKPRSPGQLPKHYSPRTPLRILRNNKKFESKGRIGLLAFKQPRRQGFFDVVEVLSPSGDLREAAYNLFSCLHRLDQAGLDLIYAEPVPETGLGRAIMDRLRKAEGISSVEEAR
ncbi:MAG: threonylcarbamoyl-AMP synthase [Methanobacteriota archaeon]|nr:MAG: threonylcarbamoyl-AMP synthase [Euryarchaeota archaeon]